MDSNHTSAPWELWTLGSLLNSPEPHRSHPKHPVHWHNKIAVGLVLILVKRMEKSRYLLLLFIFSSLWEKPSLSYLSAPPWAVICSTSYPLKSIELAKVVTLMEQTTKLWTRKIEGQKGTLPNSLPGFVRSALLWHQNQKRHYNKENSRQIIDK